MKGSNGVGERIPLAGGEDLEELAQAIPIDEVVQQLLLLTNISAHTLVDCTGVV